jgi:hypothetical protein
MTGPKIYRAQASAGLPDWDKIEKAPVDVIPWPAYPRRLDVRAQVCYDRSALKVRLEAREENILSRFSGLVDMVCLDSCLEFFFAPNEGDPRYFNFEFNPRGAMYLGFGSDRNHSIRQYLPHYRELFAVKPFTVEHGWGIEFSIPLEFIKIYAPDFSLEPGKKIRANFYKCGDETETPHYLAWNPVDTPKPDFHRPEFFGEIVFE